MELLALLVWFVLVPMVGAGVMLFVLGFKGLVAWSAPYCVSCRYDLRARVPEETPACPECGADLTRDGAVGFVQRGARKGMVFGGLAMALIPLVVIVVFAAVATTHQPGPVTVTYVRYQTQPVVRVFDPSAFEDPAFWNDLHTEVLTGGLTNTQADGVLAEMSKHMAGKRPYGWGRPLTEQSAFLASARQANLLGDGALVGLADAYFGASTMLPSPRIREGLVTGEVRVNLGAAVEPAHLSDLPIVRLCAIKSVRIGGRLVPFWVKDVDKTGPLLTLELGELTAGRHAVEVEAELGFVRSGEVDAASLPLTDPAEWPATLQTRKVTLTNTMTVVGHDEPFVRLATGNLVDPGVYGLRVRRLSVHPENGRKLLGVEFELQPGYRGPVSFDVAIELGGEQHDLGPLYVYPDGPDTRASALTYGMTLDALDAGITTADVVLTPNPAHVDGFEGVTRVWGEVVRYEFLPLSRDDDPIDSRQNP